MASFSVQAVFEPGGVLAIVGQVSAGPVCVGQKTNLGGQTFTLSRIEKKHQIVSQAETGDMVGLFFDGFTNKSAVASGQTLELH
ncbi:MAG: hypothetical protein Q8P02_01600 [Candidatus Micrarchaeota archaeon]|nr:hypothetical protein [Candidatus Micrarchaeota archaeon]